MKNFFNLLNPLIISLFIVLGFILLGIPLVPINGEQLYTLIGLFLYSLFALPFAIYEAIVNFSLSKLSMLMFFILALTPFIFIIRYGIKTRSSFVGKSIISGGLFLYILISLIGVFCVGYS